VIVVTIGTLFSTAIARIFPSSVCGPLRVGGVDDELDLAVLDLVP